MKLIKDIIFAILFLLLLYFIHVTSFVEGYNTCTDVLYDDMHNQIAVNKMVTKDIFRKVKHRHIENVIVNYRYLCIGWDIQRDFNSFEKAMRNAYRIKEIKK